MRISRDQLKMGLFYIRVAVGSTSKLVKLNTGSFKFPEITANCQRNM